MQANKLDNEWVKKIYNFYSGFYDIAFSWALAPHLKKAISLAEIREGQRILEIGIGTGLSLKYYPHGCSITGIDLSQNMLWMAEKKVRKRGWRNISLHIMDASSMDFRDGLFDYVIAGFVMTVCPDYSKVLNEMTRVLREEGKLVIVNHFMSENRFLRAIEMAINPLTKKLGWRMDLSLKRLLDGSNIEIEKKEKLFRFAPWSIVIARKKIQGIRAGEKG